MHTIKRNSLLLYAVTDRSWLHGKKLAEEVEKSIRGGVTFVQLREKDLPFDQFVEQAREVKA
ncbi:MAG: thiamine phosphate synthase, partial [Clostridium sp.]